MRYEDAKGIIEIYGYEVFTKMVNPQHMSTFTVSKKVFIYEDFVIKFGGNDNFLEWQLWHEVSVVKPNEVMMDILVPVVAIKEATEHGKYWTVMPRVNAGIDYNDWNNSDETGSMREDFVKEIEAQGYFISDLHHQNVSVDDKGFVRTFDYSWWNKI